MRKILLGAVYYGLATPLGVVLRLTRDPLARRWHAGRASYWTAPARPRR